MTTSRLAGMAVMLIAGVLLVLAWIVGPTLPVIHSNGYAVSLDQAHAICSSSIGVIGQALSPQAAQDCRLTGWATAALDAAAVIGMLLLAGAGLTIVTGTRGAS